MMEAMTGSDGAALSGDAFWRSPGIAAPAAAQALRARRTHPAILWLGPVYGVMEQTTAGSRMDHMSCSTPQEARDSLGYQFRTLARRRSIDPAVREEFWSASAMLETKRRNEMAVADRRSGWCAPTSSAATAAWPNPEPPRPADPDSGPASEPVPTAQPGKDWPAGGLLGQGVVPGSEERLDERWEIVPEGPMVPPGVTRDARQALAAYPQIVMLAAVRGRREHREGLAACVWRGGLAAGSAHDAGHLLHRDGSGHAPALAAGVGRLPGRRVTARAETAQSAHCRRAPVPDHPGRNSCPGGDGRPGTTAPLRP